MPQFSKPIGKNLEKEYLFSHLLPKNPFSLLKGPHLDDLNSTHLRDLEDHM